MAFYCNKKCQKAAWPTHKVVCLDTNNLPGPLTFPNIPGQRPTDLSVLGYPSFSALAVALQDFREAHEWSFRSLAKTIVLKHGGIDWSQNPQKLLSLRVAPVAAMGVRERNRARTFQIHSYGLDVLDDIFASNPPAVTEWTALVPRRKTVADAYRWHPNYAGLLPVNVSVYGLNLTFVEFLPQFRPSSPTPLLADGDAKEALLENILALAMGSINAGIPLRPVEGSGPEGTLLALPGRFVRGESGSWTWRALFSTWEEYTRGEHGELDDLLDSLGFRHTPAEIMIAFNTL